MQRKRIFLYVFIGLVAFFFSSGFLGFCVGPDYVPASIEFTDPPDGQVLDPGTTSVTIHGRVVAGDNEPMSLKAENMSVPFNKATGEFEYEFFLNPDCIYSTCTFQVIDTKGVINKERISFAVGDSYEPGADGVVDDAVRLLLTDGFMDAVEDVASPLIGPMLDDLIELPMVIDLGLLGQIVIDTFDIGEVALQIDIKEGDKIGASIYITPEDVGGTAVFAEGYHDPPGILLPDVYIAFSADAIIVENAGLTLSINEDNEIIASLDLSDFDLVISGVYLQYGLIGAEIPDWLMGAMTDLLEGVLQGLSLDLPIMNLDDLVLNMEGVDFAVWPMYASIFTSTDTDMTINLGVAEALAEGIEPLNPGLDRFFATPGDDVPELYIDGDENLIMAISDDMLNQTLYNFVQAGLIQDMDVTEQFKEKLGLLAPPDLEAYASLSTPPICDFSGAPLKAMATDIVVDAGRIIVPNLVIELYNAALIPPAYPSYGRISIDMNAALKLTISDDGTHIQGGMDLSRSESEITFLYTNTLSSGLIGPIGGEIANKIIEDTLRDLIDIEIPVIELDGATLNIDIVGTELSNNCLVAKLRIY